METSEVNQLLKGQTTFAQEEDGLKIYYVLPQEEREDRERGFRIFSIGQPADWPTRCVLLLGETGAGKTTFINAVINHLFGVRFEDSFRLRVKEETQDNRMETESQTDFITVYTIYYKKGMKHEYNFVLIDTPGLADTRGAQQQHYKRCHLEAFLTSDFGVDDLNCVGLVAKASINKDLHSEKAVLGEIISLLGNTVPDITHIFATFTVGKPVVDTVLKNAGVGFKSMFEFDNGILFTPTNTGSQRRHANLSFRWDNMSEQYETFFDELISASPVNLEILREKKLFDVCKKNMKAEIRNLATLGRAMYINKKILIKYELQKVNNECWMKEETVEKKSKVNLQDGLYALNCNLCKQTCMVLKCDNSTSSSPEGPQDGSAGGKLGMVRAYNTVPSVLGGVITNAKNIGSGIRNGISYVSGNATKLRAFGAFIAVGTLVVGGVAAGIYLFNKHKNKQVSGGADGEDSVCGKDGCSHTLKEHTEEDEMIVKENEVQRKTDENMKKLHDEAISGIRDVSTKINNGKQEILNCIRSISHSTVDLLNHAKRIQELTSQDSDYIKDVGFQLVNEIRSAEPNFIPRTVTYVNILTRAMRRIVSYADEDVFDKHKLVEEMLMRDHEQLFNSTQRQDT